MSKLFKIQWHNKAKDNGYNYYGVKEHRLDETMQYFSSVCYIPVISQTNLLLFQNYFHMCYN
jgi:hypothetical protein